MKNENVAAERENFAELHFGGADLRGEYWINASFRRIECFVISFTDAATWDLSLYSSTIIGAAYDMQNWEMEFLLDWT